MNIISYGRLQVKGYVIAFRGCRRVVVAISGEPAVFNAESQNMRYLCTCVDPARYLHRMRRMWGEDVQIGSLMHIHRRLGHLHYDTILQLIKDSASKISLTNELRKNCRPVRRETNKKLRHEEILGKTRLVT